MQEQPSSVLGTTPASAWPGRWVSSATQLGPGAWIALALTFFGWFALDTLRVEWGPFRHGVHFYDMADVIAHPARLFNGLEANRGGLTTGLFMVLCAAALLAPWALSLRPHRLAWLGWFAPLALVVGVALVLRTRTSGELFQESGLVDTVGKDVRHLANHVFRGASAAVAQKITPAAGGYLALLSSAYLAWCGIQRGRKSMTVDRQAP
jgi:hypothetical protein